MIERSIFDPDRGASRKPSNPTFTGYSPEAARAMEDALINGDHNVASTKVAHLPSTPRSVAQRRERMVSEARRNGPSTFEALQAAAGTFYRTCENDIRFLRLAGRLETAERGMNGRAKTYRAVGAK